MLYLIATILHIPLILYPCREQIYIFYKLKDTPLKHCLITLVLVGCATFVPCIYPSINGLFGILGGLTTGTCGFTLPLFLEFISEKDRLPFYHYKRLPYLLIFLVIL